MWHIYKSIWIFTPTFFSSSSASNVIKTVHATRPHCLTSDLKITRIEKNWRESRGWQRKQASQDGNRYATKWNNGEKGSPLIFMRFFLERNTYVTKSIYPQLTIPTLIQVVCMWFIITIIRNFVQWRKTILTNMKPFSTYCYILLLYYMRATFTLWSAYSSYEASSQYIKFREFTHHWMFIKYLIYMLHKIEQNN